MRDYAILYFFPKIGLESNPSLRIAQCEFEMQGPY